MNKPSSRLRPPFPAGWRPPLLAIAVALLAGCATRPHTGGERQNPEIALLADQADRWDQAIVRKDRAAIEANLADDFRQIDFRGNVHAKAAFVDALVSADLEIDPYAVEDFDVRLYGDVALVSGRTRMTGRYQGQPFTSHYRYLDVYVRQANAWKIVSVQITQIPETRP